MTPRSFARGLFLALGPLCPAIAAAEGVCGDEAELIWTSCDAAAPRMELLLLPEDAGLTPPDALDVTGGYTASDRRDGSKPKPVGLFVRKGEIVSREYVRMDGVLIVDAAGAPRIVSRRKARLGDRIYDLDTPALRAAFLASLAAEGASALQSHLLVVNGVVDAFPSEGAPLFRRRILLQMADGTMAVWDTSPRALTLADATAEAAERFAPQMALNLDMGSYDFCSRGGTRCGALSYGQTGKLSNVLRFSSE